MTLGATAVSPELLAKVAEHNAWLEVLGERYTLVATVESVERDGAGKVLHRTRSVTHTIREKGVPVSTVISASKDGVDDKAAAQEQARVRDTKPERKPSPFLVRSQPNYLFTEVEKMPEGFLKVAFTPKGEKTSELLEGEALIDPNNGELVVMNTRPARNPPFVDKLEVQLIFSEPLEGRRALSKTTITMAGGALFVRRAGSVSVALKYQPR